MCIYIPGPSSSGAKWFRYRVSIYHPLGFKWHPLEGAGTVCIYIYIYIFAFIDLIRTYLNSFESPPCCFPFHKSSAMKRTYGTVEVLVVLLFS